MGWADSKKHQKKTDKFNKLKETDDYILKYTFTDTTTSTTAHASNHISGIASPRMTSPASPPPEIMRTVRKFLEKERAEKERKMREKSEKTQKNLPLKKFSYLLRK